MPRAFLSSTCLIRVLPLDAAGDYGFDPLRIGGNPELLPYYREAELMNGRWAMAAVAGILFTDAFGIGPWWEAGTKVLVIPPRGCAPPISCHLSNGDLYASLRL